MAKQTPLLTVGPAPHLRTTYTIRAQNVALLLALAPTLVMAMIDAPQGAGVHGTLGLLALGAGLGLLTEYLTQVAWGQPYHATNGHGLLVGLLIALMLPPTVPWWVLAVGVIAAIVIGKQAFGGLGAYPFHPAMVGLLIVTLSWPHHVFPIGGTTLATTSQTALYLTLAGGVVITLLGHVRWEVPLLMLAGVGLGALLLGDVSPHVGCVPVEIMEGHVLLAAFFILPDPTGAPANRIPLLIFALVAGFLTVLIRAFGVWPDAIPFAVVLVNILSPLLDRIRPNPRKVEVRHA